MVEVDELYIHAGMKDKSYNDIIIIVKNRMPRIREV